ncbi:MFS transporter [Pseudomonas sp. Fl4BN1]|uniref:MFS transporter n=1 Tax=Pseudomonas sp. Fl4BN1 TaxID=2697651 RepID=UPI001377FA06|nr:MFS transporter [Pseudomonas sp. Fl4BN1]NBF09182.1 MFS transporter [Pseudomonas sp. Fl4BN1]
MRATAETDGHSRDASHRWLLITITLCASVLPATFLWAPALSMELAAKIGLTPTQIGAMFSLELICSSLATLPAFFWLRSAHWQRWALLFMGLYIGGNLLSAFLLERHFSVFLLARGLTALAAGSLLILCTRSVARLADRGRAFGSIIFSQLILGTVGMAILPLAFRHVGPGACFALQALLMLGCLALYRHFAHECPAPAPGVGPARSSFSRPGLLGVASIFLLYICLGGIWTFISALQAPTAMDRELLDQLLTLSSAMGILGAGAATLLGRDQYRGLCLLLGFAALILALLVMATVPQVGAAFVAVLVFKFAWTLLVPFMLTVISLHDRQGGLINLTNLVLGLGLASGPALCGYLLETFHYQAMFTFGAVVALLAAVAINLSHFHLQQKSPLHEP